MRIYALVVVLVALLGLAWGHYDYLLDWFINLNRPVESPVEEPPAKVVSEKIEVPTIIPELVRPRQGEWLGATTVEVRRKLGKPDENFNCIWTLPKEATHVLV